MSASASSIRSEDEGPQGTSAASEGTNTVRFSVVHVAAGSGSRLGGSVRKGMVLLDGHPLWWHGARTCAELRPLSQILVLHPEDLLSTRHEPMRAWMLEAGITQAVAGGASRQASVRAGVQALAEDCGEIVLVHDAARPLVLAERVAALLLQLGSADAALLASRVTATVQRVDAAGFLSDTLQRDELRLASTPQGARSDILRSLLERAAEQGRDFTDEAALCRHFGVRVALVEDAASNIKITTQEELSVARTLLETPRVGHGYDIHRLVGGGPLRLGGVDIPVELHLLGHSDGDALLHAVIEALLGAAGLPDIGEHFPDTDSALKGADSRVLLQRTLQELRQRGWAPAQVDCSLIAERPRLGPHKASIKTALCALLDLPPERVAVKARTNEGLDAIGRGEAIAVHVIATLRAQG
ncbi:MAG: 2-C-methyl-D-erythritol 2,4-cyclodiphosphate synthase [Planctomycetes bacterium]|nr:2-C-methyl-D-erythritol 2,4-cyclodiphosphate synthase [Planctomycetota bacterium]